jgi:hypothetical protein
LINPSREFVSGVLQRLKRSKEVRHVVPQRKFVNPLKEEVMEEDMANQQQSKEHTTGFGQ